MIWNLNLGEEIYSYIARARDAIRRGDLVTAKRVYAQLQPMYKGLRLSTEERKKIYYEVLELKTDIELGALA